MRRVFSRLFIQSQARAPRSTAPLLRRTVAFTVATGTVLGLTQVASAATKTPSEENAFGGRGFTLEELAEKRAWFHKNFPHGINLEQFTELLGIKVPAYASMLFKAVDTNGNGIIDVNEYLVYASIATNGTSEEKIKFQFSLYDINGDGHISFDELVQVVRIHLQTGYINPNVLRRFGLFKPNGKRTPEELALALMKDADMNRDYKISFPEFRRLAAALEALSKATFEDPHKDREKIREILQSSSFKPIHKM